MKRKSSGKWNAKKGGFQKKAKTQNNIVTDFKIWPPVAERELTSGPEKKYVDVDTAVYQINTTGSITLLNGMIRGTDAAANRIGRKVTLTKLFIRGYCSSENSQAVGTTTVSISQLARCLVIYDRQTNAATPALLDILKEARPESQLNINNRERFTVLLDWQTCFGPCQVSNSTFATSESSVKEFKEFRSLRLPMQFNATNAGDVTDINSGAIFMVWVGNVAAGTGTDGNARLTTRITYLDD